MSLRRGEVASSNVAAARAATATVTGTTVTAGALAFAQPAFGQVSVAAHRSGGIAAADVTTRRKWALNAHLTIDAHLRVNRIE